MKPIMRYKITLARDSFITIKKTINTMKKQLLLIAMLIGAFVAAEGQKPDTARVLIHYKFTHVRDTTNRAHPYTENMVLYVGKSASAYRSYDAIVANAQFKKAFAEAAAT